MVGWLISATNCDDQPRCSRIKLLETLKNNY